MEKYAMAKPNPTARLLFAQLNRRGYASRPATDILDALLDMLPLLDPGRAEELTADYLALYGE